jgi:hypothetical protein
MRLFARNRPAEEPEPEYEPTEDGLPYGFEPPPDDRLADVYDILNDDVATASPSGFPDSGHPARPLPIEEAVERIYDDTQASYTHWAKRQVGRQPALLEQAQESQTKLAGESDRVTAQTTQAQVELDQQRAQLSEPDLAWTEPVRKLILNVLPIVIVGMAGLELLALEPVVGQVVRLPPGKAWGLTVFAAMVIMLTSYSAGAVLHRCLSYEGPLRIRAAQAVFTGVLAALALAALVGIVTIRVVGSEQGSGVVASPLYTAIQGGIQLVAALHGWSRNNPRIRQIRRTELRITKLAEAGDELTARIAEAADWEASLAAFRMTDWLPVQRCAMANRYSTAVLEVSRSWRTSELLRLKHPDSVNVLTMLPLPKFIPPTDSDDDEGLEWLTAIMLTL